MRNSLVGPSYILEDIGKVQPRGQELRTVGKRCLDKSNGTVDVAPLMRRDTEMMQRARVRWILRYNFVINRLRFR